MAPLGPLSPPLCGGQEGVCEVGQRWVEVPWWEVPSGSVRVPFVQREVAFVAVAGLAAWGHIGDAVRATLAEWDDVIRFNVSDLLITVGASLA